MSSIIVPIAALSSNELTVEVHIKSMFSDFENAKIVIKANVVQTAVNLSLSPVVNEQTITASNASKIPVVHADGTPSLVPLLDSQGNQVKKVVGEPEPIYQLLERFLLNDDGTPSLDENGNPILDGESVETQTGVTEPETELVTTQETIGEFDAFVAWHPQVVEALKSAVLRNFANSGESLVYIK